jgi:endo-1,4-beta-D-glucanase Y
MKHGVLLIVCGLLGFALCAAGAERRPFPQHTRYAAGTLKPNAVSQAQLDQSVVEFYRLWKAKYLRTAGPDQLYIFCNAEQSFPARTVSVSEGHGYGMLATVLMAGADPKAQADFDALFRYFRAHPALHHPGLMAWRQLSKGQSDEDHESATDGDLDIALALLMADAQWGSGEINYRAAALKTIAAIRAAECDLQRHTLTLGSWVDPENRCWGGFRPSDFMPAHLKAFAAASGDPVWTQIADTTYRILGEVTAAFSPATGLAPDFVACTADAYRPAPSGYLEGPHDGAFFYNACRVPWRVGTDALLTGDRRSRSLLAPLNAWVEHATGGDPGKINAGYRLNGAPLREDRSAAFNGSLTIAAMIGGPDRQPWLNALWTDLTARRLADDDYFGNTIKLLTMIAASGNWWQPGE